MGHCHLRLGVRVCLATGLLLLWGESALAIALDQDGELKLGVRTYVNARIGTEDTHKGVILSKPGVPFTTSVSGTFPYSPAGHLRQNRGFVEVELHHDLRRLVQEGVGPFSLLNNLPFTVKRLAYHLTFRGEGDGIYDWGPKEYRTANEFEKVLAVNNPIGNQTIVDVAGKRQRLRRLATHRERLFQAYIEGQVGRLYMRVGRQILSWGETDAFQLLDRINPTDSSFGGFLIPLDERRVPLDMAVANYYLGYLGPLSEAHLQGFVAIDNSVGFYPGTPQGSPWALPSLGGPSNTTRDFHIRPGRTISNARGGFQFKFNALDATFGLAHYYTRFDTEALQVFISDRFPNSFDEGLLCANGQTNCGYPAHVYHTAPKVQVSGVSTTFAVPQIYSVVRSEIAYFKGEPAFTQAQLDPFIMSSARPARTTGGRRLRDSINAVIGLDANQFIRFLNPHQTFFISTQFFYKHIKNTAGTKMFLADGTPNPDREVLPIQLNVMSFGLRTLNQRLEPLYISQPADHFLHTLFIGTSYRSGMINPSFTMFYDWGGAFVYQPAIMFSRDPFRFAIDYSIIDSHIYKGGSGVSLLKDRDNIQFRFEYVI